MDRWPVNDLQNKHGNGMPWKTFSTLEKRAYLDYNTTNGLIISTHVKENFR